MSVATSVEVAPLTDAQKVAMVALRLEGLTFCVLNVGHVTAECWAAMELRGRDAVIVVNQGPGLAMELIGPTGERRQLVDDDVAPIVRGELFWLCAVDRARTTPTIWTWNVSHAKPSQR